jgi:hypothetical protein
MELESLVIITVTVILVLQIVSLFLIAGMGKSIRALKDVRPPSAAPQGDRFDRKNNDFRRHDKRPFQDGRPQRPPQQQQQPAPQQHAQAAADPVEKSLRDINLRLKNAERDQEFARRKLQQDNFNRGDRDRDNNRNRDDRGDHRGGRDRDRHRGGHNRDNRRDNWQDRNRDRGPQSGPAQGAPAGGEQPSYEKREILPGTQPEMSTAPLYGSRAPVMEPAAQAADMAPADFASSENLEHGRKVVINRNPVVESAGATPEASGPSSPSAGPIGPEEETTISNPGESSGEIIFGRRKGQQQQ